MPLTTRNEETLGTIWRRLKSDPTKIFLILQDERWTSIDPEHVVLSARYYNAILSLILAASLAYCTYYLILGIGNATLDSYAFRQTQTAISAYWLAKGGPWINYETPVLGYPWSIPFEFPTYQWIVAGLASVAKLSINTAGRIVSFAFFVGCLWPIWILMRTLRLDVAAFLIASILYMLSPIYTFWARTVMIETAAVFFCAMWLAYMMLYLDTKKKTHLLVAAICGCLGILTKLTTFPAFGLVGGAWFLWNIVSAWDGPERRAKLTQLALIAAMTVIVFAVGLGWVAYSDTVKSLNTIGGEHLTSAALQTWNFGTFEQRTSSNLWIDVLYARVIPDTLGYGMIPAAIAIGASLTSRRYLSIIALALAAFLSSMLLFTNLHIVHTYYQAANAIFLVVAVALGLHCLGAQRRVMGLVLLVVILGAQVLFFQKTYVPRYATDFTGSPTYSIATAVKAATRENEAILVFGNDWSSEVPYYSERKGFAVPGWARLDLVEDILAAPEKYLGGLTLGAIVDCYASDGGGQSTIVKALLKDRAPIAEFDRCRLFAPPA